MFKALFTKVGTLASHHQVIFAAIVAFCFIVSTWAIEQIFEHYIITEKSLLAYLMVIALAILLLWITQHYILHVI